MSLENVIKTQRNKIISVFVVCIFLVLQGCGTAVEIPPASVGKILTKNGFQEGTLMPSKFRLEQEVVQ